MYKKMMANLSVIIFSAYIFGATLDEIGVKENVDKSSIHHNYTQIYETYFNKFRNNAIKFLEIGFFRGASARMWQEYFPQAQLYLWEYHAEFIQQFSNGLGSRCHFFVGDQANKNDLAAFIERYGSNFDVILDDGGHFMQQQIVSFEFLFPHVKSGGLYIIEDLHTSYWQHYGGQGSTQNPKSGPGTTIEYLKALIDDVNYLGARTYCANLDKCSEQLKSQLNYYQLNIKSMHFYDSLCIIVKR